MALAACHWFDPPAAPEATCLRACEARASQCTRAQCLRGCTLALDRLVEREGARVVACVASSKTRACDDRAWAHCSVRVGGHADGGPPAPPPAKDYDPDEDGDPPPALKKDDDDLTL